MSGLIFITLNEPEGEPMDFGDPNPLNEEEHAAFMRHDMPFAEYQELEERYWLWGCVTPARGVFVGLVPRVSEKRK